MISMLISGSRAATPEMLDCAYNLVVAIGSHGYGIIVGDAPGIDAAVAMACRCLDIPVQVVSPVDRRPRISIPDLRYVRAGNGYIMRDYEMVRMADCGFCIWNGKSAGTKATYDMMLHMGKPVRMYNFLKEQSPMVLQQLELFPS